MIDRDVDFPNWRKAIDSTVMLTLARFLMPAVLAVGSYFITTTLSELKDGNKALWVQLAKLTEAQATTSQSAAVLASRMDGTVKQLDRLQVQVDRLPQH